MAPASGGEPCEVEMTFSQGKTWLPVWVFLYLSLDLSCDMEGSETQQMELRSICSLELLPPAEGCQGLVMKTVRHYVFPHGSWRPLQKQVCKSSRYVRWPRGTPKCPRPEHICPGIHWLENAVVPLFQAGTTVHATVPPWSPPLSGCWPVFFVREREESKTFRGRRWKILISTHSLLCVLR